MSRRHTLLLRACLRVRSGCLEVAMGIASDSSTALGDAPAVVESEQELEVLLSLRTMRLKGEGSELGPRSEPWEGLMDAHENERITAVGPGTMIGELLRRYWHPIGAVDNLFTTPVKALRLMGEDLVLYRDRSGAMGLLPRHCPHRRADLSYGWVENHGLRCSYHGWLFDHDGSCLEQPYEDCVANQPITHEAARQKAYLVKEHAGMLFAYLGPDPPPLVPNWEPFTWENGFIQVVTSDVPCNWLQTQDNSIDPVHFEWLHDTWQARLHGNESYVAPRHQRLAFDEFEFGFTYRRIREGLEETSELWTIGRVCLWPNALFTGDHFEWRVPIDDENTLSVCWFFDPVPSDRRPYSPQGIASWSAPVRDPVDGRWLTSHIMNQDFVSWVGQGTVSDREHEHLARSDRGVALMRRRLIEEAAKVSAGGEPKGLVREAAENACIQLPIINREYYVNGPTREEYLKARHLAIETYGGPFAFLAGQPQAVREAYDAAMGV